MEWDYKRIVRNRKRTVAQPCFRYKPGFPELDRSYKSIRRAADANGLEWTTLKAHLENGEEINGFIFEYA